MKEDQLDLVVVKSRDGTITGPDGKDQKAKIDTIVVIRTKEGEPLPFGAIAGRLGEFGDIETKEKELDAVYEEER